MNPVETVARRWHDGSDHAAYGATFGGPMCNCLAVAERMMPMLAGSWWDGAWTGWTSYGESVFAEIEARNPFREQLP